MTREESQHLQRRDFLAWLCKIGGGAAALTLAPDLLPLRRVNTVLFGGTAHAQEPCGEDVCTTRDICQSGDTPHICQVQDVCDVDESGDCTGDRCGTDTSGPCTNDGGGRDEEECPADNSTFCSSDSSGACTNDGCVADSSGYCQTDLCTADSSANCSHDRCTADSSGICTNDGRRNDDDCATEFTGRCVSDSSGSCTNDSCTADSSNDCPQGDACTADSSQKCNSSDTCVSDSSGLCAIDQCTADSSGDCSSSDTCIADSSGICTTDSCTADSSGDCTQSDACHQDESGECTSRDRCSSDYSGNCAIDVCVLDGSTSCDSDLCREDRSPTECTARDTCALDLARYNQVNRRRFARAGINRAIKMLYHLAAVLLVLSLACLPAEADTVINAAGAAFSDIPIYSTAGSVSVPEPVGRFLRDCDADGVLEADTNGDGRCAGDPEVRDYRGTGSRELPEGTAFTGNFQYTCFHIPSDVTITSSGPLTVAASRESAVFGTVRAASGIRLSATAVIDLRTSAWLSEDGSAIRFITALAGEVDETPKAYAKEDNVAPIDYTSLCANLPQLTATPGKLVFGVIEPGQTIDHDVVIANEGDAPLVIGTLAQTDPPDLPFSLLTENCSGRTLAPAETCTFSLRFAPVAVGPHYDSIDIPTNDPNQPLLTYRMSGGIWDNLIYVPLILK